MSDNPYIAPGAGNPLIGRYAFWVDDEASKVNINQLGHARMRVCLPMPSHTVTRAETRVRWISMRCCRV